jgi:DNA-binding MarR family transcriptional regulator
MGRGLSKLQRQILLLALREGFATCQNLLTLWGVQPGAISDRDRYAAAHSSLSRALTRLWWRGLIEYWRTLSHYRTAVTLTDEGKALAEAILEDEAKDAING